VHDRLHKCESMTGGALGRPGSGASVPRMRSPRHALLRVGPGPAPRSTSPVWNLAHLLTTRRPAKPPPSYGLEPAGTWTISGGRLRRSWGTAPWEWAGRGRGAGGSLPSGTPGVRCQLADRPFGSRGRAPMRSAVGPHRFDLFPGTRRRSQERGKGMSGFAVHRVHQRRGGEVALTVSGVRGSNERVRGAPSRRRG
jgi:hypothetical protein